MPRFFFHLRDDLDVIDEEGTELPDLAAARRQAVKEARSLACEQVLHGRLNLAHYIDIEDDGGAVLATVTFGEVVEIETEM